jgi:hypothetical protein
MRIGEVYLLFRLIKLSNSCVGVKVHGNDNGNLLFLPVGKCSGIVLFDIDRIIGKGLLVIDGLGHNILSVCFSKYLLNKL